MNDLASSLKSVFGRAIEIGSPDERAAYLDRECGANNVLRAEVEGLIQALDKAGEFMQRPADAGAVGTIAQQSVSECRGSVIGPYKLLEQIGEGGMGVVFMAEQARPVQRRVALKIIKAGMDTREVVARFEAERQALAMMDHPNIARVLDAGATDTGRPFFVMELVRGVAVTEYCNEKNLSIRERLELFVTVCQAVQHAHQKGIIHRDIKPTNVLVTLHDSRPMIKVIDFGVAKATGQKLTDKTLVTGFTQMIGTPLYMSPEQAEMTSQDIDTRSDIFSLGVLLYELLTGTTPFDSQRLKSASFDELRRIIREEEPPRPSTRLTTIAAEAASTVGTQRKTDPRQLSRLFRGELDWIVMKCLEKDRTRRYETASALAGDVERYLHDEPVQACPPSARYRSAKFVRRNKAALITAAAVMLSLIGGIAGTTWGLVRTGQALRDETAEHERADQQSELALNTLRLVINDIQSKLALIPAARDVRRSLLNTAIGGLKQVAGNLKTATRADHALMLTHIELGDTFLRTLGSSEEAGEQFRSANVIALKLADDDPHNLQAQLDLAYSYDRIGALNKGLGKHPAALDACKKSLEICTKLAQADPQSTKAQGNLAVVLDALANEYLRMGNLSDALSANEKVFEIVDKLAQHDPDNAEYQSALAGSYQHLGMVKMRLGNIPAARDDFQKELEICQRLAQSHPNNAKTDQLGCAYRDQGDVNLALANLPAANDDFQKELEISQNIADNDPHNVQAQLDVSQAYGRLGEVSRKLGNYKAARDAYQKELDIRLANNDDPHYLLAQIDLVSAYLSIGHVNRELGSFSGALDQYQKALAIALKLNNEFAQDQQTQDAMALTFDWMDDLARAYLDAGRINEAVPLLERTLKLQKAKLGPDHGDTSDTVFLLAISYLDSDRLNEAVPLAEEATKLRRAKLGPENGFTLNSMNVLALCYQRAGRIDEAIALHEETLKLMKSVKGPDHEDTFRSMNNLANAYLDAGRTNEALRLAEETLELTKAKLGPEDHDTLDSMEALGIVYMHAGRLQEALPLLEQALKLRKAKLDAELPDLLESMNHLATAYIAADRLDKALPLLEETLKIRRAKLGPENPDLDSMESLAEIYLRANRFAEADAIARECVKLREKIYPDGWRTFSSKSLLGGVLLGQKKYAEAEPLLVSGYEGMHERLARIPAYDKTRVNDVLQRLVQLYEATNQPDKAAAWKVKLSELDRAMPKENPAAAKKETAPTKRTESAKEPNPTSPAIQN